MQYDDWDTALTERPECLLDTPDMSTPGGPLIACIHNSTMSRALEGLWSNQARTLTPLTMNKILQGVRPRRDVIQVERPSRGDQEADASGTEPKE